MSKGPVRRQVPPGVRELHAREAANRLWEMTPPAKEGIPRRVDFIGLPILLSERFDRQRPYVKDLTEWCANYTVCIRNHTYRHSERMKSILYTRYSSGTRLFPAEVQQIDKLAWVTSLTEEEEACFKGIFPRIEELRRAVREDYVRAQNEANRRREQGTEPSNLSRMSATIGSSHLFTFMSSLAARGSEINLLKTAINTVQLQREAEQKALGTPWTGMKWQNLSWNSSP